MSSGDNQQSQALAKPTFTEVQASALVESVFGFKVSKIQPLPSYDDQNFHVHISRLKDTTDDPSEYVLKISNTESSKTPDLIEMQNHIIMFLRAAGFPTAFVCRTKGDNTTSLVSIDSGSEIKSYLVRMLTYLPGRPIAEIPINHQLLYEIGRLAAKLDKTLEKFQHPKLHLLHREDFIWNLKSIPLLEKYVDALGQNRNREIVEQVIQLFKEEIMTKLSNFREFMGIGGHTYHSARVRVRRQLPRVISFLLLCGFQILNSGLQSSQQVPLPIGPSSHRPLNVFFQDRFTGAKEKQRKRQAGDLSSYWEDGDGRVKRNLDIQTQESRQAQR
ncbi:hydroxylysine kinase isoform X3 [Nannospalax galili]|uniref:hydroxylysine kinase isoform X3 n=1 Tax=Nannospalax galili TaxID=1026970 RepID=UPI00111C17DC|nr:hydroxylysine kinase isoform X3 [Nannospalax galili]